MTSRSLSSIDALRLKACMTPSRASIRPTGAKDEPGRNLPPLPDYISPEPKTASEKREWQRLATRMDGECNQR
ncbi:hypothetical protein BCR35DRAFT_302220 [Leucosporidium creatinivorum]|uniref:Uncharacterized protein n=1 Tax=Leucosporidium creatinivorum TaxID=106004 RepID=A0A1Y2FV63_9BASI|nr:hypothetical protein BCR35DRAFT_302220 [Leucosporidium creatinivorum]